MNYPIIIRSSSINEDTNEKTKAGKYLSVYNNTTRIDVINSIYKCIKSGEAGKMALIIQSQLFPLYSGVSFIYTTDKRIDVRIEIAKGLGEMLVSGKISPYVYSYDYEKKDIKLISKSKQRIAEFPITRNCKIQPTDDYEVCGEKYRVITRGNSLIYVGLAYDVEYWNEIEKVAEKVALISKKIYELYGDSDIEWVYTQNGELVVVQRRPITKKINSKLFVTKMDNNDNGTTIVPGVARGRLISLKEYKDDENCIIYSPFFLPKDIDRAINCRGILSTENSLLSHSSILAREYQLPYWAGFNEDLFEKFQGQYVEVDFSKKTISNDIRNKHKSKGKDKTIIESKVNDIMTCVAFKDKQCVLSSRAQKALKTMYPSALIDRLYKL